MIKPAGTLYLVSTPIGNLEDITLRALRVLEQAALVACEDTRHTARLFDRHGISTPRTSFHEHNEQEKCKELLQRLLAGDDLALVSDAGTPAISDPGYRLVRTAAEAGVKVVPIPGPSAALAALTVSGISTAGFAFLGFLPPKLGARRKALEEVAALPLALVLYEAPHRLQAMLEDMADVFGPTRRIAVARELTKMHEEVRRGTAGELLEYFSKTKPRGEITLVVAPLEKASQRDGGKLPDGLDDEALGNFVNWLVEERGLKRKAAAEMAANLLGVPKGRAYNASLGKGPSGGAL
jgi:16S rRNA (cytidine1402-2'-O)-methyltransferase